MSTGMRHRVAAIGVTLAVLPLVAACGGGSGPAGGGSGGSPSVAATSTAGAARWWSSTDYCEMLRQTATADRSVLSGAADPSSTATTRAFLAEIQRAAPTSMRGAWHTLAGAVTALVTAGGDLTRTKGVDAAAVGRAVAAIAADAKAECGVDLAT